MQRIFLDASVVFSACYSAKGHSRDLLLMALRGEIQSVSSEYVLEETRRNLEQASPDDLVFLNFILESMPLEMVRPTKAQVVSAAKHVALKDAPILAAVKRAGVDVLVTLDKKHLLGIPALAKYARAKILTPLQTVAYLSAK